MPLNVSEARDQIFGVLKTAIAVSAYPDILIAWEDSQTPGPSSVKQSWLKPVIRHATGGRTSLGNSQRNARYSRGGNVLVQINTPIGDGKLTSDILVGIIMTAYESGSTPNGVWFRNVRLNEVGIFSGYSVTNIVAEFSYDDIH